MSWLTLKNTARTWGLAAAALLTTSVALSACGGEKKFKGALLLGGQKATTEKLDQGYEVYVHYCRACHGDNGDGHGNSSTSLRPPPRDFRQGSFKFGSITGGLPSDDDFKRIIRYGLKGTAMLPWDLNDDDLNAVIAYIKTFSPRWQPPAFKQGDSVFAGTPPADGKAGLPPPKDTWTDESKAVERGKYLYHVKASCGSCHPSYVTRSELSAMAVKSGQEPSYRDDMYGSAIKESQYTWDTGLSCESDAKCTDPTEKGGLGLSGHVCIETPVSDSSGIFKKATEATNGEVTSVKTCKYRIKILPPDFTTVDLRSVRLTPLPPRTVDDADRNTKLDMKRTALDDLYRVIAGGIYGTPMPTWKGTQFEEGHNSDEDIWAIAHYVYSLTQLKGTPGAVQLQLRLRDASNVAPPSAPAPAPVPAPAPTPAPEASASGSASAMASGSASAAPSSSAPPATSSAAPATTKKPPAIVPSSTAKPTGAAKPPGTKAPASPYE